MSQQSNYSQPRRTAGASQGGRRVAPSTPRAPQDDAARGRTTRRRRRRRRSSPLSILFYLIFVLGVSALLAGLGWTWANDILALNKESVSAVVVLPEDIFSEAQIKVEKQAEDGGTITELETVQKADMGYVADLLHEKGLIEHKTVFRIFASITDARYELTPGSYELTTDMDYRALLSNMGKRSLSRTEITVTIPEGMTQAQIFALLEEKGVASAEELRETAATYDFKFSFLKDVVPLGEANRLEGYLFPDTYNFYIGEDPVQVLNKMILRFDELFTDEMRQQAADKGRTVQDIVTIASMIEKETDGTDQGRISSVIYNRLNNPAAGGTYGYLNIDAAILYATGGTEVDTSADTPYNTYTHTGLPPTAISSPGAEALYAALNPDSTGYYYYALGDDGTHTFFQSYSGMREWMTTQERYQNG